MFANRELNIHFVGIGGIGMSGIAEVLNNLGYSVSGSDLHPGENTGRLTSLGVKIFEGHHPHHVNDADVVVVSSAVSNENVEVSKAHHDAIPVIKRAEMLAELMRLKFGIAVAGTHGKTSTTSLLATVMSEAGLDPTIVIGGKLNSLGSNAKLGQSDYMVVEADESDGSFLQLSPVLAVVTNIDPEHLDHYGTIKELESAFEKFANKVPFYGAALLCMDHPRVQSLIPSMRKRYLTYGLSEQADYRAVNPVFEGLESKFMVSKRQEDLGEITLRMPGAHNVLNGLAVTAVASELGVDFTIIKKALNEFQGVQRRFTIRGVVRGTVIVDDYGHHPAEIMTTLGGARRSYPDKRVVAVFQPHRYTRVKDLWDDFARSFNRADVVCVTDIYGVGEIPIEGVSGESMAEAIRKRGHRAVFYTGDIRETVEYLKTNVEDGDLVITLGAGDVWRVGDQLKVALVEC